MADSLFDLDHVLSSKKDLTSAEENILEAWKTRALQDFVVGAGVGSGVVWAATRRFLTRFQRLTLSLGAAYFLAMWKFEKSLDSSVDNILSLEGSRMQTELASIMMKKYQDNPGRMQPFMQHFYSEEVYDDSNSDKPMLRWRMRCRHIFGDTVAHGQGTSETATKSGIYQPSQDSRSHQNPPNNPLVSSIDSPSSHGTLATKLEVRQSPINPGVDMKGDPLDCVFGELTSREEIHHPATLAASTKAPVSKSRKKSHRRRRRHQEIPLDTSHA